MNRIILNAEPLTKEAFKPYGDVIEIDGAKHYSINLGTVERYHDLANVDIDYSEGGRAIISIATINNSQSLPFQLKLIERHPKASQAFIPMFDAPVYIVVAVPSAEPQPEKLKAFVSNGKQGFNYNAGVWHMPLMTDQEGRGFIVIDRAGPGNNCDEYFLENHTIELR